MPWPGIETDTNSLFDRARSWRPARDPLVLDLDGNGITTTPINPNAPLLFDQDGDGTLTATGWIGAGEALVVRDLNANGKIDSGRELFGDSTVLTSGIHAGDKAANGFEALADLDSNADGKFDANDTAFTSVQLWKDTNQNGISEAGELFSFADLGVASINVAGTASNVNLGGGNTQTFAGNFTRTSGQTGSAGTAELAGSLLLANNNFYRQFTDDPQVTPAAAALPQMQGSGVVRDLRPAMSLGTTQAATLQAKLGEFAATTTRAGQMALVDDLLLKWADTSAGMVHSVFAYLMVLKDGRYVTTDLTHADAGDIVLKIHPEGLEERDPDAYSNTAMRPNAEGMLLLSKLNVLEAFNGTKFFQFTPPDAPSGTGGMRLPTDSGGGSIATALQATATLRAPQIALINQAYDALKESVYGALVVQTRLQPYLDSIGLVIDESGVRFDTSASMALVQNKASTDALGAVGDLVDLQKHAGATTNAVGWQVYQTLEGVLESSTMTTDIQNLLAAEHIVSLGAAGTNYTVTDTAGWTVLGNAGANTLVDGTGRGSLYGMDGDDSITGNGDGDYLSGGNGNDRLWVGGNNTVVDGGDGDDVISMVGTQMVSGNTYIGGKGNDTITGTFNTNTYIFNLGDGQDTINNIGRADSADVLKFGPGIAASDVSVVRSGNDVVFKLANGTGTDQITVKDWFVESNMTRQIEQIRFDNNTVWSNAEINTKVLTVSGTAGADTLSGVAEFADSLSGLDGDDSITGNGDGDYLSGGNGNDRLWVGGNNTVVDGGDGDDVISMTISQAVSGNTYIGGKGNDTITGTFYTNTYIFNLGDGQDTINLNPAVD